MARRFKPRKRRDYRGNTMHQPIDFNGYWEPSLHYSRERSDGILDPPHFENVSSEFDLDRYYYSSKNPVWAHSGWGQGECVTSTSPMDNHVFWEDCDIGDSWADDKRDSWTDDKSDSWVDDKSDSWADHRGDSWADDRKDYWADDRSDSRHQSDSCAASLLGVVCDNGGEMSRREFEKHLSKRYDGTVDKFVTSYPSHFSIHESNSPDAEDGEVEDFVRARTNIRLCIHYSKKGNKCPNRQCYDLHVCKYFLLSDCQAEADGMKCRFSHDLDNPHNRNARRRHLLHKLSDDQLRTLVIDPANRNETTLPVVCQFYQYNYSTNKGCEYRPKTCPFLHMCAHYLEGDCKFGKRCKLSHDLRGEKKVDLLAKFGLPACEMEILELLRSSKTGKRLNEKTASMIRRNMGLGRTPRYEWDRPGDLWQYRGVDSWLPIITEDAGIVERKYQDFIKSITCTVASDMGPIRINFIEGQAEIAGIKVELRRNDACQKETSTTNAGGETNLNDTCQKQISTTHVEEESNLNDTCQKQISTTHVEEESNLNDTCQKQISTTHVEEESNPNDTYQKQISTTHVEEESNLNDTCQKQISTTHVEEESNLNDTCQKQISTTHVEEESNLNDTRRGRIKH
ncbi:hypothetical protein ScPMuIL_018844 [Solemya velum]